MGVDVLVPPLALPLSSIYLPFPLPVFQPKVQELKPKSKTLRRLQHVDALLVEPVAREARGTHGS